MGLPRLEKGLCGCSLEVGSKIVAWICLIWRVIDIIRTIFQCFDQNSNLQETLKLPFPPDVVKALENASQEKIRIMIIEMVITAIIALFDILLLIGLYKKRPLFIIPWPVVQVIFVVCKAYFLFKPANYLLLRIGYATVSICFEIYGVLLVVSHYRNFATGSHATYHDG